MKKLLILLFVVPILFTSCTGDDGMDGIDGIDGRDGIDGIDGIDISEVTSSPLGTYSGNLKRGITNPDGTTGGLNTVYIGYELTDLGDTYGLVLNTYTDDIYIIVVSIPKNTAIPLVVEDVQTINSKDEGIPVVEFKGKYILDYVDNQWSVEVVYQDLANYSILDEFGNLTDPEVLRLMFTGTATGILRKN